MTKICFVATTSITIKSFVLPIAEALHNELGWDVSVACAPDESLRAMAPSCVTVREVAMSRGVSSDAAAAIKDLEKLFRAEQYDIVQYSTPNASLYASIAAKKAGIKNRFYAQWGIRYVGFEGIKRLLFKAIEKKVCRNSTRIFSVSPLNMQFAIDEGLCRKEKISVIGNGGTIGVDLSQFDLSRKNDWRQVVRAELDISEDDFVFGFVGRFSRDKGGNELLAAMKATYEKNPASLLLVIGPDEAGSDIDAELVEWCRSSGCVAFTGLVPKDEVARYCSAVDVLVHPTYREGFGMVIQEAGALAVPAITTNVPGAKEVMVDGESCRLVPAKNTAALGEAMEECICDCDAVRELGVAARARVECLYERSVMLRNQVETYRVVFD